MSTPSTPPTLFAPPAHATVTRTYRVAVKHGEDYTTIEEVLTLPSTASEAEIQQAVEMGWRVFEAQREAVLAQITQVRAEAPAATPEPASDGQRKLIDALAVEIGMADEDLHDLAVKLGVEGWEALTKRQASSMIDELKRRKTLIERQRDEAPAPSQPSRRDPAPEQVARARAAQAEAHERAGMPAPGDRIRNPGEPATETQLRAITRAAGKCGDRRLAALAGQVTQVLGPKADPKALRSEQALASLSLTKGKASQLITILNDEAERASARVA